MKANEEIVKELTEGIFEEWKEMKKSKPIDYNLDFEQGKDRKAAIALKGAMFQLQKDKLEERKLENIKIAKQLQKN
jgi:hypothetical protein